MATKIIVNKEKMPGSVKRRSRASFDYNYLDHNRLCIHVFVATFGVFGTFHPVFDARRNQLQHEPGDHGDENDRDQGFRLKDCSGFDAFSGNPGEDTFENSRQRLGNGIELWF